MVRDPFATLVRFNNLKEGVFYSLDVKRINDPFSVSCTDPNATRYCVFCDLRCMLGFKEVVTRETTH